MEEVWTISRNNPVCFSRPLFYQKIRKSVCELEEGKLYVFDGDYEEYRHWRRYQAQQKQGSENNKAKTLKVRSDSRIRKPSPKAIEKKLNKTEEDIAFTEHRLSEIEEEMEMYATDYERLSELLAEKKELEAQHEELISQWLSLQDGERTSPLLTRRPMSPLQNE